MNKRITTTLSLLAMAMTILFTSCDNDDDYYVVCPTDLPTAVVTVKPLGDTFILQLDDSTVLKPVNMVKSPFGEKEVRALVNYNVEKKSQREQDVHINWMDSIRTKLPVETLGEKDKETYGEDPLEIVNDWVTVAEDGYLTLRVRTRWGNAKVHFLNLVTGTNPENPYDLVLRQDAKGDTTGYMNDALIAFNLRKLMEGAEGDKVKFTLHWKSYSGDKKVDFTLRTKQAGL